MDIAVLMWYNDSIKKYADNFYKINQIYCEKHNYTLIKSSTRTYTDRHPTWERFPLLLKHIESYDYVMWIDADAHFYVDAPPVENLINKYNKDIILCEDIPDSEDVAPSINAGVIIMKNTPKNIDILKKWAYSEELMTKSDGAFKKNWIKDQAIIRWHVKYNLDNINDISVVAPYMEIQHFNSKELKNTYNSILNNSEENYKNIYNNPYIHHFAGAPKGVRIYESKKYLKENSDSSDSSGMIVGIVLGSIIFIILIYYLIYGK
jgi:hypothetical protein